MSRYPTPTTNVPAAKSRLLALVKGRMRARHLSPRTVQAYAGWIIRYIRYHGMQHFTVPGNTDIIAFLTYLADQQRASRPEVDRARLPAVLSRGEVRAVLGEPHGATRLIALLLYGARLRLLECLTLRLKDLDFARGEIVVRRGKGGKDQVTRPQGGVGH